MANNVFAVYPPEPDYPVTPSEGPPDAIGQHQLLLIDGAVIGAVVLILLLAARRR